MIHSKYTDRFLSDIQDINAYVGIIMSYSTNDEGYT